MKLFNSIVSLLLPVTALAAKAASGSGDAFASYHAKSLSSSPIKLDDTTFTDLTRLPRNHTSAVLLTALDPRVGCQLCREFAPEWDLLAKSWIRGDRSGESRLVFGTLDFQDGRQTFQSMQLQTAPVLLLYLPTTGPHAKTDGQPVRYDFGMGGAAPAETIHAWISAKLPEDVPRPALSRPVNWVKIGTYGTIGIASVVGITVLYPYLLPILQNRNLWAAISVFSILLFCSGHMFNHIRGAPYMGGNGRGGVEYFAGGFQNQYGLESQIVGAMYGVLSLATIALALNVPRIKDPKIQQVAVFAWGGVIFVMYSFLLSVFRVKNGGYPFWLPPF